MSTKTIEPIRVTTTDGWIVVLNFAPWSDAHELSIGKTINGKFYTFSVGEHGNLVQKETNEGERTDPLMRIPGTVWYGLAEALRGITPEVDKKEVDAELKATKYHLEDMRKLMKIK